MMMNIDLSPIYHALMAVLMQCVVGLAFDLWGAGGAIGCMWFIAREHTQAEYRWIAQFGAGKRANMPWWGGFDWRVWDLPSLYDFLAPLVATSVIWFIFR